MDTFYRSSRLHFIGSWKARIEALQASLGPLGPRPSPHPQQGSTGTLMRGVLGPQGGIPKGGLPKGGHSKSKGDAHERSIIHLDMDCFFASVAALGIPELEGKALAVCHSNSAQGTGEVSSANYAARKFGIRAGT